jgi:hypothetical protein
MENSNLLSFLNEMFNLSSDVISEGQFILFQDMRTISYQYPDTPT